jgi:FkbM family methyltransferase
MTPSTSTSTAAEAPGRLLWAKHAAAAVLCHPLVGRLLGALWRHRIPHRGSRIETPATGDPRVNALLFWRMYESAEIRFVREYVERDLDVVELGSSLGGVSCEIAGRLGGERRMLCVEGNGRIVPLLRRNLARNCPWQSVAVVEGAIDYSGAAVVEMAIGESNLNSMVEDREGSAGTLAVPATGLSRLIAEHVIGTYVLVADIEGAEAGLLLEDVRSLDGCRMMIAELHDAVHGGAAYRVADLITLIEATGLRLRDRYGDVCMFRRDPAAE